MCQVNKFNKTVPFPLTYYLTSDVNHVFSYYIFIQLSAKTEVLSDLASLARSLPVSKFDEFCRDKLCSLFLDSSIERTDLLTLQEASLTGLSQALQITDPAQHVMPALYQTVVNLYPLVNVDLDQVNHSTYYESLQNTYYKTLQHTYCKPIKNTFCIGGGGEVLIQLKVCIFITY